MVREEHAGRRVHDESEYRLLHVAVLMAYFCVGAYAATFGPALPFLADDLGVSLDTAGLLLTVFFVGSIAASASIALALHGRDTRALCIAGLVLATAGTAMIAATPWWPVALVGVAVLGLGDGLIVASTHILMSMTSRDVPSAINRINIMFAVGAVAGPLWAGGVLDLTGERSIAFAGVAVALAVTLLVMIAASGPLHERLAAPDEGFRMPGNPTAWVMGAVLFLYVGAEFGLGSWVSTYVRESSGAGVFGAAALSSGYWFALMCGRLLTGVYFARRRESLPLLIAAVAGAGISGVVLAATTGNLALSAGAAFAAGLCLGPVWPVVVAIAAENSPADATAATVTMGNAGGIVIPWLQGLVLVSAGPREGVLVTSVLCAAMLAITLAFRGRQAREGGGVAVVPPSH